MATQGLSNEAIVELRATLAAMQEHVDRVDMRDWYSGAGYDFTTLQSNECDTVGCFAGHTLARHGRTRLVSCYSDDAANLLHLPVSMGEQLFYVDSSWPSQYSDALDDTTPGTQEYLDVIRARVEHFIATDGRD